MSLIQINVGQCGNQIGANYWEKLIEEHNIDKDGKFIGNQDNENHFKQYIEYHFRRSKLEKKYIPRAILVDLDCNAIDDIKRSSLGKLFKPENMIYPRKNYGNTNFFAKGRTEGKELADTVLNAVRIEAEACDYLHGFNIVHSISGGTGSGLGAWLISEIKNEYYNRIMLTNTVMPNSRLFRYYHAYNSLLSYNDLVESTDLTMLYDNDALGNICSNVLNKKTYKVDDVNSLISRSMLAQTACERLPSQLKLDLRKFASNAAPSLRKHFFIPSLSFTHKGLNDIFHHLVQLDSNFNLATVDLKNSRTLTFTSVFRGQDLPMNEIDGKLLYFQNRNSNNFVEWMGNNLLTGVCQVPEKDYRISGAFFNHTTAVQEIFKRTSERFTTMFKRKAFLHWYTGEGMDEMWFTEARSNVDDLASEYQQFQDATEDIEGEAGEEEAEQA